MRPPYVFVQNLRRLPYQNFRDYGNAQVFVKPFFQLVAGCPSFLGISFPPP
jgi:hypothetical protein